jgi:hypothetical protein
MVPGKSCELLLLLGRGGGLYHESSLLNVDLMVMLVLFGGYFLYFGFATWHKSQLQAPLLVWRSDKAKSN